MKINLRESLGRLDLLTDNKYDLRNTYDSSNISNDKKKMLAESISKNASAKQIYNILNEAFNEDGVNVTEKISDDVREGMFGGLIGKDTEWEVFFESGPTDILDSDIEDMVNDISNGRLSGKTNNGVGWQIRVRYGDDFYDYNCLNCPDDDYVGSRWEEYDESLTEDTYTTNEINKFIRRAVSMANSMKKDFYVVETYIENGTQFNGYAVTAKVDPQDKAVVKASYKDGKVSVKKLKNESLTEASYGGAYDIEDDMFWTKDDLIEFSDAVCDKLTEKFGYQYDIADVGAESNNDMYITIMDTTHDIEADVSFRIKMSRIRAPRDLMKYLDTVVAEFVKKFEEEYQYYEFDESLKEAVEDEIDVDEYEETDFNDGEVEEGDTFIEDGREWSWIERIAGPIHLDFDNWAVWSARDWDYIQEKIRPILTNKEELTVETLTKIYDEAEVAYFVVDEDTGFIDWGPVESQTEAQDFLNSKVEDWENDEYDESLQEGIDIKSTGIDRMPLYMARDKVNQFKSDAKKYPYWVIKTSKWYDPEGLNIPSKDFNIQFAGTQKECEDKIQSIISEASNNKYDDMVIEDSGKDFVKIYYPHAVSKAMFSVIKNNDLKENKQLKESYGLELEYEDIDGDGSSYTYEPSEDAVLKYLWDCDDCPEWVNSLPDEEYGKWFDSKEFEEWLEDNLYELFEKHYDDLLDYFKDDAQTEYFDKYGDEYSQDRETGSWYRRRW